MSGRMKSLSISLLCFLILLLCPVLSLAADGNTDNTSTLIKNIQILPAYSEDENAQSIPSFMFDADCHDYNIYITANDTVVVFAELKTYESNTYYDTLKTDNTVQHSFATGANYDCYPINAQRFRVGETPTSQTDFPIGETHDLIFEVGTSSDGETLDIKDRYTFHVYRLPKIATLSASDADGNELTVLPEIDSNYNDSIKKYTDKTFTAYVPTETFVLNIDYSSDAIQCFVGESQTPVETTSTGKVSLSFNCNEYMVSGKQYADIPIKLRNISDGIENEYHFIALRDSNSKPVFSQNLEDLQCNKNSTIVLSVAINEVGGANTTYQWYCSRNGGSFSAINGEVSPSYSPPTEFASSNRYYCLVTNTVQIDGYTCTVPSKSNTALVKVDLDYVSEPIIILQPGKKYAKQKGKVQATYNKFEYDIGTPFDPLYLTIIEGNEEGVSYNNDSITFFYNDTNSTENAIPLSMNLHKYSGIVKTRADGTKEYTRGYVPVGGLPVGEWYVFGVVTARSEADPSMTASVVTDFIKFTYNAVDVGLDGSGTETDPYLLKNADDFARLKFLVDNGMSFGDTYFEMTEDVELPVDWKAMGVSKSAESETLPFSGILDGGGHTLSYGKGSEPLFNYVRYAVVKNLNLYGEEINGSGLVNYSAHEYNTTAITIENVTLKSGSSTLKSGFVSGGWTYTNLFVLRNCTVEEGVVIGYAKDQDNIGSFVGGLVGTVDGCTSGATVYGISNVGGIVGVKSNSMGAFSVKNCAFTGNIFATGDYVGGIVGNGYNSESAPNTLAVVIENCYAAGTITGNNYVGGILGAEYGLEQAWDNGIGYIRNNHFAGAVTANASFGIRGGIVGYMRSLNKNTIIENNYYLDTCGADSGIGKVVHVDTDAVDYGYHNGVFYYNTAKDDLDAIKLVVDGADDPYMSVTKTNQNRSDDPLGADADKLTKAVTAAELADGTVVNLLNQSETSFHNWEQGEKYPELSDEPIPYLLTITGDYQKDYYIGDELSTAGMVFTLTYSDGKTKTVNAGELSFSGFDSSKQGECTVVAAFGAVSASFKVTVLKKDAEGITVYFTLLGDDLHDSDEDGVVHTLAAGNLQTWITRTAYTLDGNATVLDLIREALGQNNITVTVTEDALGTAYIPSITRNGVTFGEHTNGNNSGWMYTINGNHSSLGVAQQFLSDGDEIVFHYTDDYTKEDYSMGWTGTIDNQSASAAKVTVADAKTGTVTVDCALACAVIGQKADGSYALLPASVSGNTVTFDASAYTKVIVRIKGDITGDGKVDSSDTLLMKQLAAGIKEPDAITALLLDLTGDGKINSSDTLKMKRVAAGLDSLAW